VTIVAVTGDCTTTTCVALASGWPADGELIVLEADPSGGSLVGWLDTPGTPSLASAVAGTMSGVRTVGDTIDSVIQRSGRGLRFIAAPVRAVPARRAIAEAGAAIIAELAGRRHLVALADLGRPSGESPHLLRWAAVTVVVHRQSPASAGAESVRLERLLEQVEGVDGPVVLAVIGREPFDPDDVVRFVDDSAPGTITAACRLAEDPLAAAVLAGRTGVSAKRLRRLPLMRSAAEAAALLSGYVSSPSDPSPDVGERGRSGSEVGS
jgi:hypothetical protein